MSIIKRRKWAVVSVVAIVMVVMMVVLSGVVTAQGQSGSTSSVGEVTYLIEISGIPTGECTVLEMPVSSVRVIEFQDGEDLILRKRPGRNSCSNLIIASDLSNPALDDIWEWYGNVKQGQYDRRSITITINNSHGEYITRYHAMGTWPVEWRVVSLEGQGNNDSVVVEIEFVVEELFRIPLNP